MKTVYKFRVILDSKEDVIRDIEIERKNSLEDLHRAVTRSFGIKPGEIGAFYVSDEDWSQGEEIPMIDMGMSKEPVKTMMDIFIEDAVDEDNKNLLYVYDFLNMWTFFVEFISTVPLDDTKEYPNVVFCVGDTPKEAPIKTFEGRPSTNLFDDAFDEGDDDGFDDEELEGFSEFNDF